MIRVREAADCYLPALPLRQFSLVEADHQSMKLRSESLTARLRIARLFCRRAAKLAANRISDLVVSLEVELSEIGSIVSALAWTVPLVTNPHFFESSIYLRGVAQHFPQWWCLMTFALLFFGQSFVLVFGGLPSAFIHDHISREMWLRLRMWGMRAALAVWAGLGLLLCTYGITPSAIICMGLAAGCVWGQWKLGLLIRVDNEADALRAVMNEGQRFAEQITSMSMSPGEERRARPEWTKQGG